MLIKKLRLSGFKSFVDPTELVIRDGLTGVVGPNGCGKSNLLEAIRWVMGENSAKSMRGGGMEDVIFAGTEKRPQRSFAEVMLTAERSADDHSAAIVGANDREIEIVRRIERGAGSAYRANGRDVRAKDVALIFADAATGAHSPALVSQGKVANIIAAKPTERRQMLEEAAGIAGLHVRRKDAEQKLRAAESNLARLADILADMEQRANALRRQAKQAERYKKLSGDIRIAEARLIFARWRDAAAAAAAAKAEAVAAAQAVDTAARRQAALVAEQSDAARDVALAREALQQARDSAAELRHRLASLEQEKAGLDTRLADLHRQQERLSADQEREDQQGKDALAEVERLSEAGKALDRDYRQQVAERGPLTDQLSSAEAAAKDAEVALAQATAEAARIAADRRVADAAVHSAQQRSTRIAAELGQLQAAQAALGTRDTLIAAQQAASAASSAQQEQLTATIDAAVQQESLRDAARAEREQLDSAIASQRAALSALISERDTLTRELARQPAAKRAIDAIAAQPGYEHALAAALGDDLLAAVGDGARGWTGTDAAADQTSAAGPTGAACLQDFVTAPPQLNARLRQIFVVDRDEGQVLAVGQRLVTRSGELRRWDGFVVRDAGESSSAQRLVRQNRQAELDRLIAPAQAALEQAVHARALADEKVKAFDLRLAALRQKRSGAEEQLRQSLRAQDRAAAAIEQFDARAADLATRLTALQSDQDSAQRALDEALTQRAAQGDDAAAALARDRLAEQRDTVRTMLGQIQAAVMRLDGDVARLREARAVNAAQAKAMRERSSEAIARLENMHARAQDVAAEIAAIAERPQALAAAMAHCREAQAALHTALATAETRLTDAEAAAARLQTLLTGVAEELSAAREHRAGAEARAENQDLRRVEMGRISGEKFECPPPLLGERLGFADEDVGEKDHESQQLEQLTLARERIGPVNLVAADELAELELERAASARESAELTEAIHRLRGSIGSLNREGRQRLLTAFEQVDQHFQRLFATLFNGGKAHLALIDSDDPLEAGLEIFAQPPGKKLQSLTLLSGGEQALTAVALIFGLFLTNPAPICVLDEVDAPLDDANIERFCDLLDNMVAQTATRYLIVTHNAVTMSRMHRLFGVTMIEQGVSQLVSVDLDAAEQLLAAE